MNFWSSESHQACLRCRVVAKVNSVKIEVERVLRVLTDELEKVCAVVGERLLANAGDGDEVLRRLRQQIGDADDGTHSQYIGLRQVAGLGDGCPPFEKVMVEGRIVDGIEADLGFLRAPRGGRRRWGGMAWRGRGRGGTPL